MFNVLVVDDEDNFRKSVAIALRMEGHSVFAAKDGQTAIDILQRTSLDLIILDLCMPHVDGWDVLAYARHETFNCHTPVIVLTALADADTHSRSLQEEVNELLVKPVSVDEIILAIDKVLVAG